VNPVFSRLRRFLVPDQRSTPTAQQDRPRQHNIFEAAATYVSAAVEDDQSRMEEAAGWVSPEALSFGVSELACRAVIALARERDQPPEAVARTLLGVPVR
jgi:hypothetical protein